MRFIEKQRRRFGFALRGIRYAVKMDKSFRFQWYGLGSIVLIIVAIFNPLSQNEFLFVMMAYFLVLITELQNSALEYALDHLHPETHDNIGRSKDMAAGAVLLAGILLLAVVLCILYGRLFASV